MQVLIDNKDGLGSLDYTQYVQFSASPRIVRKLNEPSVFRFQLLLASSALAAPALMARVEALDVFAGTLFTGYVISNPVTSVAGYGEAGLQFALEVEAWSDEILLDFDAPTAAATLLSSSAQENWQLLSALSSGVSLPIVVASSVAATRVELEPGRRWSELAGKMASSSRSAYRALGGTLLVNPIGSTTHVIQANDAERRFDALGLSDLRWLADDVTVCGQREPAAYVTEVFQGDGATTSFQLTYTPFAPLAREKVGITDLFEGATLNSSVWTLHDPGSHLALTALGLTCSGGSGRDAEATVSSLMAVELGGLVTFEGDGIAVSAGSAGMMIGLYEGTVSAANCFAGFAITSVAGQVVVAANVNGAAAGASLTLVNGHLYTFRIRLCCLEMERVRQSYVCVGQTGITCFGGASVAAGGQLEMEVQDVTSGSPAPPVVLCSIPVASVPTTCVLGLVDSGSLICSIKSVRLSQSGPISVAVAPGSGTATPQILASEIDGGQCHVTSTGKLTFYSADVHASGSLIFATYRSEEMAVARRNTGATSGLPSVVWLGSVDRPKAWSRVDCDNAAAAILASASASSVAVKGTYQTSWLTTGADLWPGDVLEIEGGSAAMEGVIREVSLTLAAGDLQYAVAFANDWAEGLSIALSNTLPATTQIPELPTQIGTALPSLSSLTAVAAGSTLSVQTGTAPPLNGGFEVRRRDNAFGPGDRFRSCASDRGRELYYHSTRSKRGVFRAHV